MKEGWKYEQMGNVCTFISGYTPAKELLSKSGSIPYYKVSDMNTEGNEVLLYKTSLYLSNAKKIIPQGSVVFPKNGGAIFTNKKRMLVCDSVVDLNTEAIFPNKNIVTTNFLYKLLLSIDLGQFDNGGGLPSINIKKMQSFTIPIPPLPEQERIVSLLDAEFAKIDAIKANAEKQLQDAKALFQSALKDYLTPKEEGKYKPIKDVCDKGSSSLKQKDVEGKEGKYPVFGASGYISSIDTYHQDKEYIAIVKDGSGIGRVTFMPAYSSVIGTMQYILPKEGYNIKYISYCLQSLDLSSYKQGAAIPHIYFRDYGEKFVHVEEDISKQEQIVSILDNISAKIQSLQSNFDTTVILCNDLKQSILKDIFG